METATVGRLPNYPVLLIIVFPEYVEIERMDNITSGDSNSFLDDGSEVGIMATFLKAPRIIVSLILMITLGVGGIMGLAASVLIGHFLTRNGWSRT